MVIKQVKLTGLLAIFLTINACQKNDPNISPDLLGLWKLREVYISTGGIPVKQPNVDTTLYVQFNSDGSLEGTAYPGVQGFNMVDQSNISLIRANHNATVYHYAIKQDSLTMANTGCIDGCPMKFVKAQ